VLPAETSGQVKRKRKSQLLRRSPQIRKWCSIRGAPATVSTGWLWEMRSAIMARVGDRNPNFLRQGPTRVPFSERTHKEK